MIPDLSANGRHLPVEPSKRDKRPLSELSDDELDSGGQEWQKELLRRRAEREEAERLKRFKDTYGHEGAK